MWEEHIADEIKIIKKYFNGKVKKINFGGGLKLPRMPNEESIDLVTVGNLLKTQV